MSSRVWLRAVEDDDVALFFEHQLDREASEMAAFAPRPWDAHLSHWNKIRSDSAVTTRTIQSEAGVAGNIVSWQADDHREVGYWVNRRFWGRGIASRALRAFLEIEQERPLYAYVAEHNLASLRVLEKCGFTRHRRTSEDEPGHVVMVLA